MNGEHGWVDPRIARELPGLRLSWQTVAAAGGRPPVARLRALSDRQHGASVVALRTHPIPRAYRTCYRQLGLDPDVDRIPLERAMVRRLLDGEFHAADAVAGGCLVALIETGVPVWPLAGAAVDLSPPGLGIGLADSSAPARGSLVVRDLTTIHAPVFGEPLPGSAPVAGEAVVLYAIGVAGVPEIHLQEALAIAADELAG